MWYKKITSSVKSRDKYLFDFYQKISITYSFFMRNELRNHAAAGAFYMLMSIIPLFLLFMLIFNTFLTHYPDFSENLFVVMSIFNDKLSPELFDSFGISKKAGSAIGVLGVLNLLFSSRLILASIQRAFMVIFPAKKRRNFIMENVISLGILPVFFVFVVAVSTLNSTKKIFIKYLQVNGISTFYIDPALNIILYVVPGLIAFVLVYFTYRYLPVRKPTGASAFKGAVLFLAVFIAAKSIATVSFQHVAAGTAYGLLGSVIIVLIWSYFVFLLYFFCAQYVFVNYRADYLILNRLFSDDKPAHSFMVLNKKVLEKYTVTVKEGETLFEMGDESENVYYVLSGCLDAVVRGKKVGSICAGEVFGEMAHITGEPRSAAVSASEDCELIVLPPELFEEILKDNKDLAKRMMGTLCARLKQAQFMGRYSG